MPEIFRKQCLTGIDEFDMPTVFPRLQRGGDVRAGVVLFERYPECCGYCFIFSAISLISSRVAEIRVLMAFVAS